MPKVSLGIMVCKQDLVTFDSADDTLQFSNLDCLMTVISTGKETAPVIDNSKYVSVFALPIDVQC